MKVKIAQVGLGQIGLETVRLAATKPWAEVVCGVDSDPAKAGGDLGELSGLRKLKGRKVYARLEDVPGRARPDLVLHTTVSRFRPAFEQLAELAREGIDVVSSCEQLIFPQLAEPRLAAELDKICRESGARIVAAGVNPGFVMDLLPICLTGVACAARAVHVRRVVNASTRRGPLQRKIGSGLEPAQFEQLFREGKAGHAGLKESLALIAHALGWKVTRISEKVKSMIAKREIRTQFVTVKRGQTCGLHQWADGRAGEKRITLDLKMYLEAPEPQDAIEIEGEPRLEVILPGGVAGDQATVAALVNTAARLRDAHPGLLLLTDLSLPRLS